MPSLATTSRGRSWLANFRDEDRAAARRLLDHVDLVSDNQFRRDMKKLLERVRGTDTDSHVAAYAIHTLPSHLSPHYFGCRTAHAEISLPGCPATNQPGSEEIVHNILVKSAHALDFSVDQTIDELYASRVRRILLVTDNIATGQEVAQFLSYMRANPRLRSWQSFGWLRFEVVTHSITETALLTLRQTVVVHFEQLSRTFSTTDWSVEQATEVRELCRKYSAIKGEALGRKRVESLQLFGHTFGNGTPAIFRQRRRPDGAPWSPLLPHDRNYALGHEETLALQDYRPPHNLGRRLRANLGRQIVVQRLDRVLASSQRAPRPRGNQPAILELLVAIEAGNTRPVALMAACSMSMSRLHDIARLAHDLELIDGFTGLLTAIREGTVGGSINQLRATDQPFGLHVTVKGKRLIRRRARKRRARVGENARETDSTKISSDERHPEAQQSTHRADAHTPPDSYYPQQLR